MRNITAFFAGFLVVVLMAKAMGAEPKHLPPEMPITSTSFVCQNPTDKKGLIVAIVYTYKDGSIARFDADHMWGLTVKQAAQLADAAPNSQLYIVDCGFGAIT
jgi:hypothetical protein